MTPLRAALVLLCLAPAALGASAKAAAPHTDIDAFNRSLDAATRQMNPAATLALWEDDGVSLLPETPPIMGKKAIASFLDRVMAGLDGAHMESFVLQCHDIQVSGDWASEWCSEHQIVKLSGGKPPFDGWGKMLFILHRQPDGTWRLREEMWNQGVAEPSLAH
jgi:Ketosteroid isomerase homolog